MLQVRTRMAPSPTGEYHPGHIRTVLYNYALAKKNKGQFVIRIEDTDQGRYVEGSADRILDIITDYGLSWDEGPRVGGPYEPYFQSQRLDIYKKYAKELVDKGHAYYCFCTPERLAVMRKEQQDQKLPVTKYDRKCRNMSEVEVEKKLREGVSYVIRQKVPDDTIISFTDEILGAISFESKDIEDGVLLKSDGFPTYHLAVVIDDHLMNVTHILRGCDWIPSTPKHILIYKALGWNIPKIAHLPNLKEVGGTSKLSKRYGAVEARGFLEEGYLPEAMLNFLMLLGWNPGTDKEIFTLEEFIQEFSLSRVHPTDLVAFDRTRLLWYNAYYIRNLSLQNLYDRLSAWVDKYDFEFKLQDYPKDYILEVLKLVQDRLHVFKEIKELVLYFLEDPTINKDQLIKQSKSAVLAANILNSYKTLFEEISEPDWDRENLDKKAHELLSLKSYKPKEAFMTIRVALTGLEATPPLFDIIGLLKKEIVLGRLQSALSLVS